MSQPGESAGFRDLDLHIHYEGLGEEILTTFVLPVLQESISYDRLTSFFSVTSLLAVAQGVESLWRKGGRMRLILGIHDIPGELARAAAPDEWMEQLIAEIRSRLLAQLASLEDELSRDCLATLAWMLEDGLLEVRVAAPHSAQAVESLQGIFHAKRFVFRDSGGELITAVGSPNETVMGLGANFEELDVHMSWNDPQGYTRIHVDSFERIWTGQHVGLGVRDLDASFARELLKQLGLPERRPSAAPANEAVSRVIDVARRSPAFAILNLGTAALYPHQERAFLEGLSRWPLRVMLADEVGLGKTLEAAAIIAYAIRYLGVQRVTLLTPAALLRQWQDELRTHFQLDFWRYHPESRAYVSSLGSVKALPRGLGPVGRHAPDLVLISAQLARGSRGRGHIFTGATELPELLVVDEAHAARLRRDSDGERRPTLLWHLLKQVGPAVPHLVLITATPMQMEVGEYHALLSLIGIPEWWEVPDRHVQLLGVLSNGERPPDLQGIRTSLEGIQATLIAMKPSSDRVAPDPVTRVLVNEINRADTIGLAQVMQAQRSWQSAFGALVRTHPGHLLTIRSTRRALERLGYRFPERVFHAPDLSVSSEVARFYHSVDDYLERGFGLAEVARDSDRARSIGFTKSTYRQRLASSLRAAELTLQRRLARIHAIAEGGPVDLDLPFDDEEEGDAADIATDSGAPVLAGLEYACRIESRYVRDLLEQVADLDLADLAVDPKLDTLMTLIGRHLAQRDRILIFSKYTDTVDSCIALFLDRHMGRSPPPHAKYTGEVAWIDTGSGPLPTSKDGIRAALERGDIDLVFCSDAAAEGLNLQAARVLINVDVPWNPARLEQRIGRVARLGQRALKVEIYNLWYPDSVEARIYSRLLKRRDLYELAVGEFPEIVGSAIRDELAARFGAGLGSIARDPLEMLQELREDEQLRAIQRIWDFEMDPSPVSKRVRASLERLLIDVAGLIGLQVDTDEDVVRITGTETTLTFTSYPGELHSLSLFHPALELLTRSRAPTALGSWRLCSIEVGGISWGFAVVKGSERYVLHPESLAQILRSVVTGEPIQVADGGVPLATNASDSEILKAIQEGLLWTPNHRDLVCPRPGHTEEMLSGESEAPVVGGPVSFSDICAISIETA